jgi:hypothetical protein
LNAGGEQGCNAYYAQRQASDTVGHLYPSNVVSRQD